MYFSPNLALATFLISCGQCHLDIDEKACHGGKKNHMLRRIQKLGRQCRQQNPKLSHFLPVSSSSYFRGNVFNCIPNHGSEDYSSSLSFDECIFPIMLTERFCLWIILSRYIDRQKTCDNVDIKTCLAKRRPVTTRSKKLSFWSLSAPCCPWKVAMTDEVGGVLDWYTLWYTVLDCDAHCDTQLHSVGLWSTPTFQLQILCIKCAHTLVQ